MTTLTAELRRQIAEAGDQPVRLEDPETQATYVIVKADAYEKMCALLEAERIDPSFYEYGEFIPLKP